MKDDEKSYSSINLIFGHSEAIRRVGRMGL